MRTIKGTKEYLALEKYLAILLIDAFFMAGYLMFSIAFYTTKNVCEMEKLQCYSYFCVGFIALFTANSAINLCLSKELANKKLWFWKLALLGTPIGSYSMMAWLLMIANR